MKTQLLLAVFLAFSITSQAQIHSESKLTKEEKRTLKQEAKSEREANVKSMLQDTLFFLKADRFSAAGQVYGTTQKYNSELGRQVGQGMVNPNLYFIKVAKDKVTVQTGLINESDFPGVTGVTIEGKISDMKIISSKNGNSTRVKFNFSSSLGYYRADCRITSIGLATATVESLSSSASMIFKGDLVSPDQATVYTSGPLY